MNVLDVTRAARQFALAEEVLPGTSVVTHKQNLEIPYANHGRHLGRNRHGLWLCAFVSNKGMPGLHTVWLAVSSSPAAVGGEFHPPMVLVTPRNRWWQGLVDNDSTPARNVCLLLDEQDRLTLVYGTDSGIFLLQADAAGDAVRQRLQAPEAWSSPRSLAGPGWKLWDASLLGDGSVAVSAESPDGRLAELRPDREPAPVGAVGTHASCFVTPGNRRLLAFEEDRRVFFSESTDGIVWSPPMLVAYFCSSWPSIAALADGTVVIAYQGEGKVDLRLMPELYGRLRPGAGCTVSYAIRQHGAWRVHDFLRSSEIVLKRRPSASLPSTKTASPFIAHMEEFWRPALAVDRHGVIWMYYLNSTRRHVYFTRFGGDRFGEHYEARGAYDCLTRCWFLQRDARRSDAIGFLVVAAKQLYFDCLPVPAYASREIRRVVFLDNLELAEIRGVEHVLGEWRKEPGPLPIEGRTGDPSETFLAWCGVEKAPDGYRMKYMGVTGDLRSNAMPGRAVSPDGIHWRLVDPVDVNAMTLDGRPFPNSMWRPVFLEDLDESDPRHRYKGLLGDWQYIEGLEVRIWRVVTSPDTLAWCFVQDAEPVVVGDISVNCHLFRDDFDPDPRRRYKGMFLMGANAGRAATLFTSPDLLHWSRTVYLRDNPEDPSSPVATVPTGPILIDPDSGESPWEEEIHDAVLWREHDLLMAHYDAFYCHHNQHISKALAISRDGRHFYRVKRGAIGMSHGNCGEWDSGRDRTGVPMRVGDELWMWFCGMPASYFGEADRIDLNHDGWTTPPDTVKLRPWGLGLAKLRVDGWAFLRLDRDAERGQVTTIPFEYTGGQLVLNGERLAGLQAEICADDGTPLPGYEASRAVIAGENGIAVPVTWPDRPTLPSATCRLRFIFTDLRTKLYSFGFVGS